MIEISQLNFRYTHQQALFSELALSIKPGGVYGLLGKNGAGKTTLLKIISGLLFAKKGTCAIMGYNPAKRIPAMLADLFMIPEEIYVPAIPIKTYCTLYAPFYPRFNSAEFSQYLNEFGVSEKEKLTALSYGQKKKFLIAFGLASNCRLLLMDEPTNGLDIPSKGQFRKLLASIISDERTIIISTHQVRDLENLIDPIIILDNGRIAFNQNIETTSRRLAVSFSSEAPQPLGVLYAEKTIGGYAVVKENTSGKEGNIDIELLFNAVTANPEAINRVF